MYIYYNGKKIEVSVKKVSFIRKFSGLMFKTKDTSNLLFEFNKKSDIGIHSFFVFFKFLVLWLDNENNVLEYKIIKPFTLSALPKNQFNRLIEIPFNKKNKDIIEFFVDKGKI